MHEGLGEADQATVLANKLTNTPVLNRVCFKVRWHNHTDPTPHLALVLSDTSITTRKHFSFSSDWYPRGPACWITPDWQPGDVNGWFDDELSFALCHTPPYVKEGKHWLGFDEQGKWLGLDVKACVKLVCEMVNTVAMDSMIANQNLAAQAQAAQVHAAQVPAAQVPNSQLPTTQNQIAHQQTPQGHIAQSHTAQSSAAPPHGNQNHDSQTHDNSDKHAPGHDRQDDEPDLDGMGRLTKQFQKWHL